MGRKNRRQRVETRALPGDGLVMLGVQQRHGLVYRAISADRAVKTYRCPWCQQTIAPGVAHIVAWEEDRVEWRRHWHRSCFLRKG